MSNPYNINAVLGTEEFLSTTYILIKRKVKRLQEIENSKKRNKLSLPLLKEKFEVTSKALSAIMELTGMLDYNKTESIELADVLNDLGLLISKGNIAETKEIADYNYSICIIILEAFLKNPDEE